MGSLIEKTYITELNAFVLAVLGVIKVFGIDIPIDSVYIAPVVLALNVGLRYAVKFATGKGWI